MGMLGRVELDGLKELTAQLHGMARQTANQVLRPAVSAAMTPVLKAARANMPESSGLAKKTLAKKVWANRGTGTVGAVVGVKTNSGAFITRPDGSALFEDPANILHLIEGGRGPVVAGVSTRTSRASGQTKQVATGKAVLKSGGQGPGTFFGPAVKQALGRHPLERAWAATKARAKEILAEKIFAGLVKLAGKGKL
jgi:hypothetical protein